MTNRQITQVLLEMSDTSEIEGSTNCSLSEKEVESITNQNEEFHQVMNRNEYSSQYLEDYGIYQKYEEAAATPGPPIEDKNAWKASGTDFNPNKSLKYPSWCEDNGAPLNEDEIMLIFKHLGKLFGFQADNVDNMFSYFMSLLDSRSSRSSCPIALLSIHADYIGGNQANYKKWYFAAHYELDEGLDIKGRKYHHRWRSLKTMNKRNLKKSLNYSNNIDDSDSLLALEYKWRQTLQTYSQTDYIYHVGLYLLVWGEAGNVRFMPECICFIFKCAMEYLKFNKELPVDEAKSEFFYLETIITPLYRFIRSQQYVLKDGSWVKINQKDHSQIIGYDDINLFFWYPENIKKLKLFDKTKLLDIPPAQRYLKLGSIDWEKQFYKTYREKRTWAHLLTNFSRIWIIHIVVFWYYTSFNSPSLYTKNYSQLLDNKAAPQIQWSVLGLGGLIACLICLLATVFEFIFIPRYSPGAQPLFGRFLLLIILLGINLAPSVYVFGFIGWDVYSKHARIVSIIHFVISLLSTIYLAITPPSKLFYPWLQPKATVIKSNIFTCSFPNMLKKSRLFSYMLWLSVFLAKFFESYLFLTLSLRDPVRELFTMDMTRCNGDVVFGTLLCKQQALFAMILLYITDLILFFLDTYLWYIICNCFFSIGLSFSLGISVFSPWRNIFARLPERIFTKIINSTELECEPILLTLQIWNSIVISMYREHLLSTEQVSKLIYQRLLTDDYSGNKGSNIRPPLFFVFQDDNNLFQMNDFFNPNEEAERRILFFAQSLSSPIPEPIPIKALPSFSVLIPHYSEKILLTLTEVLKESKSSKVSLLEYLKKLHPSEWDAFVKDTKVLTLISSSQGPEYSNQSDMIVHRSATESGITDTAKLVKSQIDDLPYYCVGFKDAQPEYTMRTRIWASLRYQTLYRTVSGFMNYDKVLRLLYELEDNDVGSKYPYTPEVVEEDLDNFVNRKFRLVIAMQRFQKMSDQERDDALKLFSIYPDIKIVSLEEEKDEISDEISYFSVLRENCDEQFVKKYRIRLPGNPILGDGKSDNQNHSIIFTRGEYLQVIDANQDNYIEECLKIKSVLCEFEEIELNPVNDYIPGILETKATSPVAFIGAREYIFSENIGILGDIAAGKEQTFGTLFARTLAEIGGKLHYGHPDFINGIFMTTRGGVSKAQKGLHLNEDIYAGMNAISRGGRIKHCDFYQCGKGRDLGFGTILNFTTKVGAGMGEQLLSREHYYLGCNLPIDRFLSFYYAHAGFHINNLFIILSVQLFMLVLVSLGSLNHEIIKCDYNPDVPFTDLHQPIGCYNIVPVLNWVTRFVLSVFICFFISFSPLVIEELIEKGFTKAFLRMFYHFLSMSPLFEVFVCQIYAKSLIDNITFGGAKYVATGRGFATSRISFTDLYSRYASQSIYPGAKMLLIICFATLTMWQPALVWFWITTISMCLAPFIFNPHQFSFTAFFMDYRNFIRWLLRGNSKWHRSSWVGFMKIQRSKYTGYKRKIPASEGGKMILDITRPPSKLSNFFGQVIMPLIATSFYFLPYMFINSQTGVKNQQGVNPAFRILIISFLPIFANLGLLLLLYPLSVVVGPILSCMFKSAPSAIAGFAHFFSVFMHLISLELLLFTHSFSLARSLCGLILILSLQQTILQFVLLVCLSKELKDDFSNRAWWSGKWLSKKLGWLAITQPFRELVVKVCEMSLFSYDFILGHLLFMAMVPFIFIPFIDKVHSTMIFWLKPSKQFRGQILSAKQKTQRKWRLLRYCLFFLLVQAFLTSSILIPILLKDFITVDVRLMVPTQFQELVQPLIQKNNDTGAEAPIDVVRAKPEYIPLSTIA